MICMLVLSFSLFLMVASCTDEDDEYKTELTKHKWYSEYTDYLLYGKDDLDLSIQTDRTWLYFLADGTGIMSCRTTDKDTYFGTSREEIAYRFNYTISGNKVRLSFKDSGLNRTLTYSKEYLIDSENSTSYKAMSFTSSDLEHAKGLADEQEFQASINHNAFQSLDVFIGFGNNLQPVKFTSYYLWDVSFSCHMPKDSQRRGITLAGLIIYVENGTITNKTGYDRDSGCTVKVTTLDGKNAYYFEHGVYYDDDTQCGASMIVHSDSGSALKIHYAYRYYDNVSKKYFTSASKEYVLSGEGIDASEEVNNPNGGNTESGGNTNSGSGNTESGGNTNSGGGNTESGGNTNSGTGNNSGNTTGTHNGHEWVDLGLSVKWATMNVGATEVAGSKTNSHTRQLDCYGEYYSWSETSPKDTYDWNSYTYCNGSTSRTMTKYCTDSYYGTVDNKTTLEFSPECDDAARKNWGGAWRMPTLDEQQELIENCYWEWTNSYKGSDVNGYIVYKLKSDYDKGKKKYRFSSTTTVGSYSTLDTHIFLPASGFRGDRMFTNVASSGSYWSSSLDTNTSCNAYYFTFAGGYVYKHSNVRDTGRSVRAVCPK